MRKTRQGRQRMSLETVVEGCATVALVGLGLVMLANFASRFLSLFTNP
jgi:hypothetical protein